MSTRKPRYAKAKSRNWEDHRGLVWLAIDKRKRTIEWAGVDPNEVASRLDLVVWWCLQPGKYDPAKGEVSTYVVTSLLREIDRTIADLAGYPSLMKMRRERPRTVNLEAMTTDEGRSIHERLGGRDPRLQAADDAEEVSVVLYRAPLTPLQAECVGMTLDGMMVTEIGEVMGRSRQCVSDALYKSRIKLQDEAAMLV